MSRLQLALNVEDLDQAVTFYSRLFGAEPAKRKPGYANFAIAEPPLKLVLFETPGQGGTINHLGVELADIDAVDAAQTRLAEHGLASVDERDTTCCYARQEKFWVQGASRRAALGGLHRARGQRDLLRPGARRRPGRLLQLRRAGRLLQHSRRPDGDQASVRKSFSIFFTLRPRVVGVHDALLDAGGHDGEPGPVQRLGDRGELGHDRLAVPTLLEHPQHAAQLALGPLDPIDDGSHVIAIELHHSSS